MVLSKFLCNFIEFAPQQVFSHVNLLHIFRTHYPWNTSGGLLLKPSYGGWDSSSSKLMSAFVDNPVDT